LIFENSCESQFADFAAEIDQFVRNGTNLCADGERAA